MAGREGTVVGPYRMSRLLGSGGVGDVYLAEGPAHGGQPGIAAIKVLRGEASDATAMAMLRQAQDIARLHQPHVLPIYQADQHGSTVYIAMAYAPAGSLGSSVDPSAATRVALPLAAGVVARLVNQVALALSPLHQQGVMHGDLKPNNLFVRTARQGGPVTAVADFGQSVVMRAAAQAALSDITWAAAALLCAAPEQLSGAGIPASDQYALATIAYLLLTGRYPFIGAAPALREAILSSQPDPPSRFDQSLGPQAEAALMRALAKSPAARFPDIALFAQALDDGLATSRGAMSGVTQQFSALGDVPRLSGPPLQRGSSRAAPTPITHPGGSAVRDRRLPGSGQRGTQPGNLDADHMRTPTTAWSPSAYASATRQAHLTARQRLSALLGGALILALAIAGVFGITMLLSGQGSAGQLPNFGGLNYAPTITPNATALATAAAKAHAAEAQLAAITSTRPVFSDSLANNDQHWPVDNKSTFFTKDGRLHLYNHDVHTVLSLDQPAPAPATYAVSVNLTFVRGNISDLAGLRVRVAPVGNGQFAHVTVLISPDGRYEVWRYSGSLWTVLDFGYTQAIVRGLGQSNTLTVLVQVSGIQVFVNQHYISTVADVDHGSTGTATLGPTVIYAGTEATYAHYALYAVGG